MQWEGGRARGRGGEQVGVDQGGGAWAKGVVNIEDRGVQVILNDIVRNRHPNVRRRRIPNIET